MQRFPFSFRVDVSHKMRIGRDCHLADRGERGKPRNALYLEWKIVLPFVPAVNSGSGQRQQRQQDDPQPPLRNHRLPAGRKAAQNSVENATRRGTRTCGCRGCFQVLDGRRHVRIALLRVLVQRFLHHPVQLSLAARRQRHVLTDALQSIGWCSSFKGRATGKHFIQYGSPTPHVRALIA